MSKAQRMTIFVRKARPLFLAILVLGMGLSLQINTGFSQQETHEAIVINVEVPVRVYAGDKFVNHLTLEDFEIYENGTLQDIEAVYLVNKRTVERSEEKKKYIPETLRTFIFAFEITNYNQRLGDTVEYFYYNVFVPGDSLIIITPLKTYRLRSEVLAIKPREELVQELKSLLRRDAQKGNTEYTQLENELTILAQAIAAQIDQTGTVSSYEIRDDRIYPLEKALVRYAAILQKFKTLRRIDQKKLMHFAEYLKDEESQKYVFLFYQREFIPQIEDRLLAQAISAYQDSPHVLHTLTRLFDFSQRDITINVDLVKQAFADASIAIHFLFIPIPKEHISGIEMQEQSDDIYGAFKEMALATGGFLDSSNNPHLSFQKAVDASENYYLIYYSPKDYQRDNKFKNIKVLVKNSSYHVKHRMGYFAN